MPKGTHLDLSNNLLTWLPETFSTLTHIVHLDLSKNQLEFLPEFFGQLKNLRQLDLYSNQLTDVPVTFSQLKNLKWLDLKNNPLKEELAKAAGPCITRNDCATAAKRVVNLMQNIQNQQEKEREKQLIHERKLAEQRRLAEEAERDKLRAEKKAAKEKRKQEARKREEEAQREAELATMNSVRHEMERNPRRSNLNANARPVSSNKSSCFWTLWMYTLTVMLLMVGFFFSLMWIYTGGHLDQKSIEKAFPIIKKDVELQLTQLNKKFDALTEQAYPYTLKAQENAKWLWEDFKARNDIVAHYINTQLGPYFCAAKKSFFHYWKVAQSETEKAWIWAKPHLMEMLSTLLSYLKIALAWLETNVPIYADFIYHKCIELANFVQTSVSKMMK